MTQFINNREEHKIVHKYRSLFSFKFENIILLFSVFDTDMKRKFPGSSLKGLLLHSKKFKDSKNFSWGERKRFSWRFRGRRRNIFAKGREDFMNRICKFGKARRKCNFLSEKKGNPNEALKSLTISARNCCSHRKFSLRFLRVS